MSGGVAKSLRSTKDRLRVASDSESNLQSLVNMPIVRSQSLDITLSENPVISLSIFTVSALWVRMKSIVSIQPATNAADSLGQPRIERIGADEIVVLGRGHLR